MGIHTLKLVFTFEKIWMWLLLFPVEIQRAKILSCEIQDSHSGDCEEHCLLGCDAT
jgi:hypothetical protein